MVRKQILKSRQNNFGQYMRVKSENNTNDDNNDDSDSDSDKGSDDGGGDGTYSDNDSSDWRMDSG